MCIRDRLWSNEDVGRGLARLGAPRAVERLVGNRTAGQGHLATARGSERFGSRPGGARASEQALSAARGQR
eukprot:5486437-Alexandrium_andersonii.AAC.1